MTSPGGGGQNINLAALWIPVLPDTSKMGEEMHKAGEQAKTQFEQGFNSGQSPESMGAGFGGKLMSSMRKQFEGFELPLGMSNAMEKLSGEVDKNSEKLRGKASEALRQYTAEYDKLVAAQQRATEAEQRYNAAKQGGLSASSTIPLLQEQVRATKDLETANKSATSSYENYNSKLGDLKGATSEAAGGSEILAGIMGGVVVAGATMLAGAVEKVVETITEGAVEAFKMGAEFAHEFADKMVELGETYEHVEIQIQEFSSATGEHLEELTSHAQKVFGELDVAGEDTGKTMAQFASMLDAEPSAALDSLTKHVEELQGRFSDLKAQNLAEIFVAFNTPIEDTDAALASLLQSARGSGEDLGVLTQSLAGATGLTLKEAGLNIQQAGAFMADMVKYGEPGRQVATGMASAMKEFGKEGLSFSDGMKLAGQRLQELGNTAEGQDLAEKLFGTRNWIIAKDAVQQYMDVVAQGPDAFGASSSSLDEFIEHTKTLSNQWEEVKHKAEEAFLPMGLEAVHLAGEGLDALLAFVKDHMEQIKTAVKGGGDFLIKFASQCEELGIGVLEFFSPIVGAVERMMAGSLIALGDFANVTGQILSYVPGMKDIGDGISAAGKAADGFGHDLAKVDVGKGMGDLAEWLKQHPIDVDAATESWDRFADHAGQALDGTADKENSMPGIPGPGGIGGPGAFGGGESAPGGADPGSGAPFTASPPPGEAAPPAVHGYHQADWDAIAQKEGGGKWNVTYTTGVPEGGGLQIKPGTWSMYGGPELTGTDKPYKATKDQQIAIAERILNGWNGIPGQGPSAWNGDGPQSTYVEKHAKGGAPGRTITGGRGQGDDVAALLGRGEYVWDTETVDKYGWLIKALHQGSAQGFDTGGSAGGSYGYGGSSLDNAILAGVPRGHYADPGEERDNLAAGMADCSSAIEALVNRLDGGSLTAPTGMYTGTEVAYLMAHGFVQGEGGPGDFRVGLNSHHTQATLPGGTNFNWGSEEAAQAGGRNGDGAMDPALTQHFYRPMSQGSGPNGGYAGLPGQFGGYGVYGGETQDQMFSAQKAVQEANDRAADLDHDISQQQKRISDLQEQLNTVGAPKIGLLGKPIPLTDDEKKAAEDKKKSLQDQLDEANYSLTKTQRERNEQDANISQAQRKEQEAMYKKPSGTGQSGEGKAGQTLGSGLLEGIGQELGFGDVFGKSPMDWGIVKLAEGLFKYANGLGDAIFGGQGGASMGGTPGGSEGLGGGLADGVLGSLGLKLPNASAISGGPNVIRPPVGSAASGQGNGAAPGPPIINQDNSVTVQAGVSDKTVLAPIQAQQNSVNSQSFQYTGGLPAQ